MKFQATIVFEFNASSLWKKRSWKMPARHRRRLRVRALAAMADPIAGQALVFARSS